MNKIIYVFLGLLFIVTAAIYFFIPGSIVVSELIKINCRSEAAFRVLSKEEKWKIASTFRYRSGSINDDPFTITKKLNNNFEILIKYKDSRFTSEMNLVAIPNDSSLIKWHYKTPASLNPVKRLVQYREALSIKKSMHSTLSGIQSYLSTSENIYGLSLQESSIKDTVLIATKSTHTSYPSTSYIYALIKKLKDICEKQEGCVPAGNPMLNVTKLSPEKYQVMVALPLNHFMNINRDSVFSIRMIPGKFIVTEVKGGISNINEALLQIEYYFVDYQRTSMAIPFQYLVTDREKESDSTKWITKIYAPVY